MRPLPGALRLLLGRTGQAALGNSGWRHGDAVHLIAEIVDRNVDRKMEPPGCLVMPLSASGKLTGE